VGLGDTFRLVYVCPRKLSAAVGGPTTGGDGSVGERERGAGEEIEGVRGSGAHVAAGGDGAVSRESRELVSKEKKELEDVVKQKEKRKLRLQQISFFPPLSSLLPRSYLTPLIHEGLHVQKRRIPRCHHFHPQPKLAFYPKVRVTSVYDLYASFVFRPDLPCHW
jgi:mitotic spindle assembly checkpoint protein MAD1